MKRGDSMTVKELKEELEFYDDDREIVFELQDDVAVESWTENRCGDKEVNIDAKLEINFMGEICGDMHIEFGVMSE